MCRLRKRERLGHFVDKAVREQNIYFNAHITLHPNRRIIGSAGTNQRPITRRIFIFRPVRIDAIFFIGV